jgi:OLD-like protein
MDRGSAEGDRKRDGARARAEALPGGGPQATRRALARAGGARAIVLVEGISDQIALATFAARRGRDLDDEGVAVVPIGGAQAIGRFLARFGPRGSDARLAGLCDAGEEEVFRRGLERAGYGSHLTRLDMERLGFHVCVADLEDELIRALGIARVEAVLDSRGDLGAFRTFQKQPAWRDGRIEAQLRRFLGSADRRKIRYARLLVEELDLARVPRPLDGVLAHV